MNLGRKNLNDLVKGIRSHKNDAEPFIKNALVEIKKELGNSNLSVKAVAVQKLTYLYLLGHTMEWAVFPIIELMGQDSFHLKRVGYLAAQFAFEEDMEEVLLVEQLLRKDLGNHHSPYYSGQAMNCLANIMTVDLAEHLSREISQLMSAHSPYVRKRAVSLMYKVFLKYPEALRPSFPKLKEKLNDNHPSVVACSVNVVCELANKNPKNYLPLAPLFYKLLTTVHSNWTLIKIVKLMGTLTPYEPRLAKKLTEPMINIINTTQAKSLLYECCYTATKGMQKQMPIIRLAVEKLKIFVSDSDQNLKYLGLLGLSNLMNKFPRIIAELKKEILDCLNDEDVTIRYRAVDLLTGVITAKNIKGITKKLILAIDDCFDDNYRQFLVERLVDACCRNNYENITQFRWLLNTLARLSELRGLNHATLIADKMMDILIRVKSIRPYGFSLMVKLLKSPHMQEYNSVTDNSDLLRAAAWLIGEFIEYSEEEEPVEVLAVLLGPNLATLPSKIQATFIQAIMKVYAAVSVQGKPKEVNLMDFIGEEQKGEAQEENGEEDELTPEEYQAKMNSMRETIRTGFEEFLRSSDVEVQERASLCLSLLQMHEESIASGSNIADDLQALFAEELNPVAPAAQEKVPVPDGLDLNQWIGDPFDSNLDNLDALIGDSIDLGYAGDDTLSEKDFISLDQDDSPRDKKMTYEDNRSVFVLPSGKPSVVEDIKVVDMRGKTEPPKKRKRRRRRVHIEEENAVVSTTEEMPEGYVAPKVKKSVPVTSNQPVDRLSQIDLTQPIGDDEQLPEVQKYPIKTEDAKPRRRKEGSEKRHRRRRERDGDEKRKRRRRRPHPEKTEEPVEPKKKIRASKRPLAGDDVLRITWNSKVKPSSSTTVTIPILFENMTENTVEKVVLKMEESSNVQAQDEDQSTFHIGPKKKFERMIIIKVKDFAKKMVIGGTVQYASEVPVSLEFELELPSAMWLTPSVIQLEEFATLMKTQQLQYRGSSKLRLAPPYEKIDLLAKELCRQLRLSVVQRLEGQAYNLYARSFTSDHVAIQLKLVKNSVNVDMKSSNESLNDSLLRYISKHFN